jgi:SAM-dependent methyltransferase
MFNPLREVRRHFRRKRELEKVIDFQIQCLPAHYMPGIGPGEFISVGEEMVELFRREARLRSSDVVLDIGCGLARVAIPLQRVLTRGAYEGFDVVPDIIHWNTVNISGPSPHFGFRTIDAGSSSYNPSGNEEAASVTFPYPGSHFTFVFATSLFSHLLADATRRYFAETARVLKPGGRALLTFFLLDDFARQRAREGKTSPGFPQRWEHGLLNNLEKPEDAVAYDVDWILNALREAGLHPRSPIRWGKWSGREKPLSYQDIVIVDKRG